MITCLKDLKPKHTTQNFIFQLHDFLLTIEDKHIPIYGQDRCFHQFMAADSKLFSQLGLKIFAAIKVTERIFQWLKLIAKQNAEPFLNLLRQKSHPHSILF